jgi:hypothetical protein
MFVIPTADDLVSFIQDFTGSTNIEEIKKCIFMAELSMRNIELPALRCDPYAPENIGVADENGRIPIPGDMNKPILFFKQGSQFTTTATATGTQGVNQVTLVVLPQQSLQVGMIVSGEGIAPGATIISFVSSSVLTLSAANVGTVNGTISFSTSGQASSQTGPWIVYDRVGDRDIITQSMIAQLYLQPVNVPAVIRGKFSEVGQKYEFLPYIAQGDLINLYYYKAWPLLFSPSDTLISATSTVSITGTTTGGWTLHLSGLDSVVGVQVGDTIFASDGTGSLSDCTCTVTSINSSSQLGVTAIGSTIPVAGTVTNVTDQQLVQNNAVLATWPEGYVYATLREYYIKRHNDQDAQVYATKFVDAWQQVEDQNNLGKWSGGHTRFTSVWQPRQYRQYNIK